MGVGPSKLEQSSLRDQVLAILRKGLVTGDLVPGSLYSASAIATELGVSTSPVREAMLTLVHQGVMEPVRNRGFRVLPMGERDRQDVHEMRMLLEVPSMVRLVGLPELHEREQEFRDIASDIVRAADDGDLVAYLNSDRRFHLGLLSMLGNERLVATVESLRDQTRQVGLKSLTRTQVLRRTAEEHFMILDALLAGDAVKVEGLMIGHLDYIHRDWGPMDEESDAGSAPRRFTSKALHEALAAADKR